MTGVVVPGGTRRRRPVPLPGGRVALLAAAAAAGFLAVGQLQGPERFRQSLAAESEGNLARILASLNAESDALRQEITDLRVQLLGLRASTQRDTAAVEAAESQLRALQVLAGTVAVAGPGVVVTVDDPGRRLTYDRLLDLVQELRDAGAEAVGVNERRVGAASALGEEAGAILLDGARLVPPYRVGA
ncbi:MAG: DUF881 domain-containing protein, partial [Acidimicrobiales bacterium]